MKLVALFLSLLLLSGCQTATDPSPPPTDDDSVKVATNGHAADGTSFAFTLPGDSKPSSIRLTNSTLTVGDEWTADESNEGVSVSLNGELKARGVFQKEGRFLVNDPSGTLLAKIKVRDDGTFKVVDSDEKMLCKLKSRDDGFKVVGPDEETVLLKVKSADGKTKIKDGNEKEIAKIKGADDPTVVTWLAIPVLPMEVRMAGALLFKGTK